MIRLLPHTLPICPPSLLCTLLCFPPPFVLCASPITSQCNSLYTHAHTPSFPQRELSSAPALSTCPALSSYLIILLLISYFLFLLSHHASFVSLSLVHTGLMRHRKSALCKTQNERRYPWGMRSFVWFVVFDDYRKRFKAHKRCPRVKKNPMNCISFLSQSKLDMHYKI